MTQEIYDNERKMLVDILKANADQHDKAVLQLASAALGLSATFLAKIVINPDPATYYLLALGWGGLFVSMSTMLVSFHTGQKACHVDLEANGKYLMEGVEPGRNRWSEYTKWLSRASCVVFMVALIPILLFSWLNLPAGKPAEVPATNTAPSQEKGMDNGKQTASEQPAEPGTRPRVAPATTAGNSNPAAGTTNQEVRSTTDE